MYVIMGISPDEFILYPISPLPPLLLLLFDSSTPHGFLRLPVPHLLPLNGLGHGQQELWRMQLRVRSNVFQ